jgi:DNA-binding transcriptional regulator YiaG
MVVSTKQDKKMNIKRRTRRGGRRPGTWTDGLTADKIRGWRESSKLSRATLANLMDVSPTSIQNWETGTAIPTARYQKALRELMDGTPLASNANTNLSLAAKDVGDAIGRFLTLLVATMKG